MQKLTGYLRLMRPANIVTAVADILAGVAIAAFASTGGSIPSLFPVFLLIICTIGLYGGGVVFNDVFDADIDRVERPERPIPSGLIQKRDATILATGLYVMALITAAFVHPQIFSLSFLLASVIAILATVYDKWGKHHSLLGPVNMGLCRGLNLLLGMSVLPAALMQYWWLGIFPVIYIGAITMISRDEVYGGKRITLYLAAFFYLIILSAIAWFAVEKNQLLYAAGFILFFAGMIGLPLSKAIKSPVAQNIRKAVKAGVIAVIIMNASWAAAFGAIGWALVILCLLPLSILFARIFAVT
ncbi:UbiA-like protein EboC [Terrimonas alba]|uniref:UbiA-like protein EboC n=1 Tax=Terrimonas alba TaxID=3349636 RepID=UPI0035F28C11